MYLLKCVKNYVGFSLNIGVEEMYTSKMFAKNFVSAHVIRYISAGN
jgi:hypothetical protein